MGLARPKGVYTYLLVETEFAAIALGFSNPATFEHYSGRKRAVTVRDGASVVVYWNSWHNGMPGIVSKSLLCCVGIISHLNKGFVRYVGKFEPQTGAKF